VNQDSLTDPALLAVLNELQAREPIFHHPEFGTSRSDLEKMTAPEFWEVGASGKCYSREYVLDLLEERYANPVPEQLEASDFQCQLLAPDLYLLTYRLLQDRTRKTRRTTIWRRAPEGWQIVYHQGTVVQD
jgi:hypothetical protein